MALRIIIIYSGLPDLEGSNQSEHVGEKCDSIIVTIHIQVVVVASSCVFSILSYVRKFLPLIFASSSTQIFHQMKLVHLPPQVFTSFILPHLSLDDVIASIRSGPVLAHYVRFSLRSLRFAPSSIIPKNPAVPTALILSEESRPFAAIPEHLLHAFVHYVFTHMPPHVGISSTRDCFLRYVRTLLIIRFCQFDPGEKSLTHNLYIYFQATTVGCTSKRMHTRY